MLKTPGWLQADYLSILLDLFPSSSSFPPLLGSRQTRSRSSPPRGHLAHPPRGHVPAISLASFSLLLTPFFLASSRLSIKTIVFLTGRAAFQTCGTQENKPSLTQQNLIVFPHCTPNTSLQSPSGTQTDRGSISIHAYTIITARKRKVDIRH